MSKKIMRDKPPAEQAGVRGWALLARWYGHVERVGAELRRTAAPPPWWVRLRGWPESYFGFNLRAELAGLARWLMDAESPPKPTSIMWPTGPTRHHPVCDHRRARPTTLGALIPEPRPADQALLGIEAVDCPGCGMTVAVIR